MIPPAIRMALGITAALLCLACGVSPHAQYATYAAAESAGAVTRRWIPPYVPRSATAISEVHDLDLNTQRLRFRAPAADLRAMVDGFAHLALEEARVAGVRSPELTGEWPGELTPGPSSVTPRDSLRYYRAPLPGEGARCLAVEWSIQTVYAWSCRPRAT